jgi:hypothetical protein
MDATCGGKRFGDDLFSIFFCPVDLLFLRADSGGSTLTILTGVLGKACGVGANLGCDFCDLILGNTEGLLSIIGRGFCGIVDFEADFTSLLGGTLNFIIPGADLRDLAVVIRVVFVILARGRFSLIEVCSNDVLVRTRETGILEGGSNKFPFRLECTLLHVDLDGIFGSPRIL